MKYRRSKIWVLLLVRSVLKPRMHSSGSRSILCLGLSFILKFSGNISAGFSSFFHSTVAPLDHRLFSRPSGHRTSDSLSYKLGIFLFSLWVTASYRARFTQGGTVQTSKVAPLRLSSATVVSSCQRPRCAAPGASS